MMALQFLAVDLQNEFANEGGALFRPRSCVPFIADTLLPFVREHGHPVVEIISDYRATPPSTASETCVPGQWGYQSIIPTDVKHPNRWVKAEPSPAWVRAGGGQAEQEPGAPYPDPAAFTAWLQATIGPPTREQRIVVVGLMLEICVLSTVQELGYRGYRPHVLFEGVDTYSGSLVQKRLLFETLFPFWGSALYWRDRELVRG